MSVTLGIVLGYICIVLGTCLISAGYALENNMQSVKVTIKICCSLLIVATTSLGVILCSSLWHKWF